MAPHGWQGGAIIGAQAGGGRAHGPDALGPRCPRGEVGGTHQQEGPGEGVHRAGIAAPRDRQGDGTAPPAVGRRRRRSRCGGGRMLPPWRW